MILRVVGPEFGGSAKVEQGLVKIALNRLIHALLEGGFGLLNVGRIIADSTLSQGMTFSGRVTT